MRLRGQTKKTFQWIQFHSFSMLLNIDLLFPWSAENNLNNENLTMVVKVKQKRRNTPAETSMIIKTNLECHHIIVPVSF